MPEENNDSSMAGIAGVSPRQSQVELWSLVLSAVAIPSLVQRGSREWHLLVHEDLLPEASHQLELFEHENTNWPPPAREKVATTSLANHFPLVVFFLGCLMVFHRITGEWYHGNKWFELGAVSGRAVLENGEWWRLVTGLTLHSGPVHLVGNVLIGGFLLLFLCGRLGSGLGWGLTMFAGILGNAINIFWKGHAHLSVGYSTAVFGTVGLMCGLELKRGGTLKQMILPLGAGLALLAMLGTEGERTDVSAHWWGLVAGLGLGLGVAYWSGLQNWGSRRRVTAGIFVSGCLLIVGCWIVALAA